MVARAPAVPQRRIYRAFGLRIAADLDLPELAVAEGEDAAGWDVAIARGAVGAPGADARAVDPTLHASAHDVWLDAPAGRFRASRGRSIIYDPTPGAQARDIRQFALGTLLGAILHQRGVLPLHANAIVLEGGAIALAGASGAGKSTLAACFLRRGHAVLSDDVCAVRFDAAGRPTVPPGLARIKLWGDALAALGQSAHGLERIADGFDKFSLPMSRAPAAPAPLRRLYVLAPGDGAAIGATRLTGAEALGAVVANIYRWPLAAAMGLSADHFARAADLARSCPVWRLSTPRDLSRLQAIADSLSTESFEDLP